MRPQGIVLEQESYISLIWGHIHAFFRRKHQLPININLSFCRSLKTGDHTKSCGLATSGRAKQRYKISILNHQI